MKAQEDKGEIVLWFSDETSFSLNPVSMYAWQAPQSELTLPAKRSKVSSMLGFIRRNNEGAFYEFDGNLCSFLWVKIIDDFAEKKTALKTYIVVDNASTHKAKITKDKILEWEKKNLYIVYLKPYCSELNPIEVVWRFMKHQWLNVSDYLSRDTLKKAVENILLHFGETPYSIEFD